TGLPVHDLGAMVGRQTPFLALVLPFALVFMADGLKGVRAVWPAALTAGAVFAVLQFATSNYISVQLTDIVAALGSAAAGVALAQIWTPPVPAAGTGAPPIGPRPAIAGGAATDVALERRAMGEQGPPPSRRETFLAFAPYLIIIVVLGITSISGITKEL